MTLSRREFLWGSLAMPAARALVDPRWAWSLEGPPALDSRVLVVLQLSGGNDGLNFAPPLDDDLYRKARPRLGIAKNRCIPFHPMIGLHPELAPLRAIADRGALAMVSSVGVPKPDRSHFKSMEVWHTAKLEGTEATGGRASGWIGRTADALGVREGAAPAIHVGSTEQPLSLIGEKVVIPSVVSAERAVAQAPLGGSAAALAELANSPHSPADALAARLADAARAAYSFSERLQEAVKSFQPAVPYPQTGLGRKFRTIAQILEAGFPVRIFHLELDGFDTHANQEAAHNALLSELAGALAAFHGDLTKRGHGEKVLTFAFSEFGRRVKENASGGTDHGAAGPVLLLGGTARGGLHGPLPNLARLDDGDLVMETDFRRVYATVLSQWLKLPSGPILDGEFAPIEKLIA